MSKTLFEDSSPMPQAFFGSSELIGHLRHIPAADILKFSAFEHIPNALLWVEFRGIARPPFQMETFGGLALQKVLDGLRTVDRRAVPDDEQVARNLAQQETRGARTTSRAS